MPWAGICRTVGAEEAQQRDFLSHWERLRCEERMMKCGNPSGLSSSFIIHPSSLIPSSILSLLAVIKQEGRV